MKLLQNFSHFLLEASGASQEQLKSFANQGSLILTSKDLGNYMELGKFKYNAIFTIEQFYGDVDLLLAQIIAGLVRLNPDRQDQVLSDPEISITPFENGSSTIEISIPFEEPLIIIPDADGPISWRGQKWTMDEKDISIAEKLIGLLGEAATTV